MANTYTAIATVTVGSGGAATIEFTSIPATYTDLLLLTSLRGDRSGVTQAVSLIVNGSTTTYTHKYIRGDGSSVISFTGGSGWMNPGQATAATSTSNTFSNGKIYIPNYASSNNKSFSFEDVSENNGTEAYATLGVGVWSNASAITSIELGQRDYGSLKFVQYSTATLYGIKNS